MLILQFIVDIGISETSFTTTMSITRNTLRQENTSKYEAQMIGKVPAATGRVVNGTEATSSLTATTRPKKRGRKPKAVPYLKQTWQEKEDKEPVAAALSAAQIATRGKLRGNYLAEHRFFVL